MSRNVRSGVWVRLRHGVLLDASTHASLRADELHGAHVVAHQLRLAGSAVASHVSAAVLLGLPVLAPPVRVDLTSTTARPRTRQDLRVWLAPLTEVERTQDPQGVPVTTAARSVVDIARTRPLREALVVADAALHVNLTTREELSAALGRAAGWPGVGRAGRACGLADGRAESPGETLMRLDILELGYTDVVPQFPVRGVSGRAYRADLLVRELGVLVEFDGAGKYAEGGRDSLLLEKRREDDLRLEGWGFVRVRWADLGQLDRLQMRLVRAREISRRAG